MFDFSGILRISPVGIVPGKSFHKVTVPFMFGSISCEFNSELIEILLISNCFTYILEGDLRSLIKTGCFLSFCRTKSN